MFRPVRFASAGNSPQVIAGKDHESVAVVQRKHVCSCWLWVMIIRGPRAEKHSPVPQTVPGRLGRASDRRNAVRGIVGRCVCTERSGVLRIVVRSARRAGRRRSGDSAVAGARSATRTKLVVPHLKYFPAVHHVCPGPGHGGDPDIRRPATAGKACSRARRSDRISGRRPVPSLE